MPDTSRPLPDLVLGDATIDRDALTRSAPGLLPRLFDDVDTHVLELHGDRAPTLDGELVWRSPNTDDRAWYDDGGVVLYLGRIGSARAVAVLRADDADDAAQDLSAGAASIEHAPAWETLRDTGLDLPPNDVACFTAAVALTHWHTTHQHCPRCGAYTAPREAGWVRRCEVDGSSHFPRTDPAVIMAVIDEAADDQAGAARHASDDGSRILLARGSRWGGPRRSVLAGFVEPGESFEQAVVRETKEESGVDVEAVRYLGSQPWPFPASLMVGCIARATSTALTPQEGEIEKIGWYSRTDIVDGLAAGTLALPGRLSIARALIEHWYGEPLPDTEW